MQDWAQRRAAGLQRKNRPLARMGRGTPHLHPEWWRCQAGPITQSKQAWELGPASAVPLVKPSFASSTLGPAIGCPSLISTPPLVRKPAHPALQATPAAMLSLQVAGLGHPALQRRGPALSSSSQSACSLQAAAQPHLVCSRRQRRRQCGARASASAAEETDGAYCMPAYVNAGAGERGAWRQQGAEQSAGQKPAVPVLACPPRTPCDACTTCPARQINPRLVPCVPLCCVVLHPQTTSAASASRCWMWRWETTRVRRAD